jgi:ribosomal protein L15
MQARVLSQSLDEQRQSMVLELYCRKAVGGGIERERDWPSPRGKKGQKEREERLESKKA